MRVFGRIGLSVPEGRVENSPWVERSETLGLHPHKPKAALRSLLRNPVTSE